MRLSHHPFFYCYKIKTFSLRLPVSFEMGNMMNYGTFALYALSSSLEMMHDLNFTEEKKNTWTPSFLSSLFTSGIVPFLLVAQTDHLLRKKKNVLSAKLMAFLYNNPKLELLILQEWYIYISSSESFVLFFHCHSMLTKTSYACTDLIEKVIFNSNFLYYIL